jgi:hypothetical protein
MAKLVAIGDSLTQGFQSLAITHTKLSYPAMIADCMGLTDGEFRLPDFKGSGGLPLNLEWLARKLEHKYRSDINFFEWFGVIFDIVAILDDVEDYWERGRGSESATDTEYHNLAVWGFVVADSYSITAKLCEEEISKTKYSSDAWFAIPGEPRLRTAYRVLNPAQTSKKGKLTQVGIAKKIAEDDGGIEHLIVWLGANNCLATVVNLKIHETGNDPPGRLSDYTLWKPQAFQKEYERLADDIIGISLVLWIWEGCPGVRTGTCFQQRHR